MPASRSPESRCFRAIVRASMPLLLVAAYRGIVQFYRANPNG